MYNRISAFKRLMFLRDSNFLREFLPSVLFCQFCGGFSACKCRGVVCSSRPPTFDASASYAPPVVLARGDRRLGSDQQHSPCLTRRKKCADNGTLVIVTHLSVSTRHSRAINMKTQALSDGGMHANDRPPACLLSVLTTCTFLLLHVHANQFSYSQSSTLLFAHAVNTACSTRSKNISNTAQKQVNCASRTRHTLVSPLLVERFAADNNDAR